ncbi:MAG: hypothetical protein GY950_13435, partial [bacterium]|nr:hypothetical protein [bacterium]
ALDEAIENDLDAVKRVFADVGTADSSYLSFIGSSDDTQGGSYEVLITTAADQAVTQEGAQDIDTLTGDETLTITLNSSNYTVDLTTGMTSDDILAAINSQKDADGYDIPVYAQVSGGKLRIYSDNYGSSQNLSVVSDTAAAASGTTGIGTTALTGQGVDVAGTIGGDTASGSGRTLTGTAGDSKGLKVYVTATTVPADNSLGDVYFTRGVAEGLRERMYEFSFPYSGILAKNIESFDYKLSNIADKVKSINLQLEAQQEILIVQFTKANEAMAQMTYLQSTLSNNFK